MTVRSPAPRPRPRLPARRAGWRARSPPGAQRAASSTPADREPAGFSIHESATIASCAGGAVLSTSSSSTRSTVNQRNCHPRLAAKCRVGHYRNLVFFLRMNVKWHTSSRFTAKAEYTFTSSARRPTHRQAAVEPAEDWYSNSRRRAPSRNRRLPAHAPAAVAAAHAGLGLLPVYPANIVNPAQRCLVRPFKPSSTSRTMSSWSAPDYFVPAGLPGRHPLPDHRTRHPPGRAATAA